jgi:hypothetical protein
MISDFSGFITRAVTFAAFGCNEPTTTERPVTTPEIPEVLSWVLARKQDTDLGGILCGVGYQH